MTFEEFIAQQGYVNRPSGGIYNPIDMFPEEGHAKPNLSQGALEELYRQAVNPGAQSAWGTMGAPGSGPSSDLFTVNGTRYKRLGGDYSDPYLAEAGVQPQYDPTYGWIVPDDVINAALAKRNPDSAMEKIAGNLPVILGSLVLGGGLYSAFSGAGAGAGGAAAGAAEGAAGAAGSALPESYWSMLADSGGAFASDAAATGAGSFGTGAGAAEFALPGAAGGLPSFQVPLSSYGASGAVPALSEATVTSLLGMGYTPAQLSAAGGGEALASLGFAGGGGGAGASSNGLSGLLDAAKGVVGTPGVSQLIGGGLNALGGVLGSRAQANAAGDANKLLWDMYQQNRADQTPYRMAGYGALGNLVGLTTPGKQLDQAQLDPGYAFRQQEGQTALDNRLRAGGKFYSGQSLKDSANYNQNFATNEFNNVFNRNAALAGIGQTATNATQQAGQQTAQSVANNTVDIGNARASGYAAGLGGIGNAVNQYGNAQQTQQLLDLLIKRA